MDPSWVFWTMIGAIAHVLLVLTVYDGEPMTFREAWSFTADTVQILGFLLIFFFGIQKLDDIRISIHEAGAEAYLHRQRAIDIAIASARMEPYRRRLALLERARQSVLKPEEYEREYVETLKLGGSESDLRNLKLVIGEAEFTRLLGATVPTGIEQDFIRAVGGHEVRVGELWQQHKNVIESVRTVPFTPAPMRQPWKQEGTGPVPERGGPGQPGVAPAIEQPKRNK